MIFFEVFDEEKLNKTTRNVEGGGISHYEFKALNTCYSFFITHLNLRQTDFWFTYSFKFHLRLNLYCRFEGNYFAKESNKLFKAFKNHQQLHKIFKENPKMLLFWVSLTILGVMWLQFVVVAESLFSSKFLNCTWDLKSTIIYVIIFVEIVEFIFVTDFLAF